jgi:SAM-dependent methyltransferase
MRDFEVAERKFENLIADRYQRDYHEPPLMQWHDDDFARFVAANCTAGDRILDLGCGPGSLWPHFKRHLPERCSLVGVDLSEGMVEEARRAYPADDFRVGSMFAIPAQPGAFDVVVVSSAFHHIPDDALPDALVEVSRVLEEHGKVIGREPLASGRLGDRGSWFAGAIMHFRHLVYRLTRTREYPEPDPGPAHHAYDPAEFLAIVAKYLSPTDVRFRHPFSPFVGRTTNALVVRIAKLLDEALEHREGQIVYYVAERNFSKPEDVQACIRRALEENVLASPVEFLALLSAATARIERELGDST